jgi:DNA invertase Pin-like site-specific DNA recombinase
MPASYFTRRAAMTESKRVAIYARVSTKDQTASNQLRDLREYCDRRLWTITEQFVDEGMCGNDLNRPELRRCMDFLRKGRCDVLLVWRFDRFARSLSHLVSTLEELKAKQIDFVSYQENVDTSTAQGRMVFGFMATLAEFERELIRERIFSGLRRAKETGVALGRPRLLPEKQREILSFKGILSHREIASRLGVGKGTVQRVFARVDHKPEQLVAFSTDEQAVGF